MRFQRVHFFILVFLICATALVVTKTSPSKPASQDDVPVINKTTGFQVVQVKRLDNGLALSLKNNYPRRITAFVLTVGDGFRITEDFITSEVSDEVGIQPQQTFERTYPLPTDKTTERIVLQAIVLDDKTGDGDAIIFEDIKDTRLAQAVQIRRSLKVLEKYLNDRSGVENLKTEMAAALDRPQSETLNALKEIRPIGTVNRKNAEALSHSVKAGLSAGREDVLRRLGEAKVFPYSNDFLLETKAHYEKLLKRL